MRTRHANARPVAQRPVPPSKLPVISFAIYGNDSFCIDLGHLECLKTLQGAGLVLGVVDIHGGTPLHAAAEADQLACAKYLFERTGADLHAK